MKPQLLSSMLSNSLGCDDVFTIVLYHQLVLSKLYLTAWNAVIARSCLLCFCYVFCGPLLP